MIDSSVNHKLRRVRTDDISGTIVRPGQTNIKGSDSVPLGQAVLGQSWNIDHYTWAFATHIIVLIPHLRVNYRFSRWSISCCQLMATLALFLTYQSSELLIFEKGVFSCPWTSCDLITKRHPANVGVFNSELCVTSFYNLQIFLRKRQRLDWTYDYRWSTASPS